MRRSPMALAAGLIAAFLLVGGVTAYSVIPGVSVPVALNPGDSLNAQCGSVLVNVTVVAGGVTGDCATLTPTATATNTATATPTNTATSTPTWTPTATATPIGWTLASGASIQIFCPVGNPAVGAPSIGNILVRCPTAAPTRTPTVTGTPTATTSPSATATATGTATPPASGTVTPTSFTLVNPNPSPINVEETYRSDGGTFEPSVWAMVPANATAIVDVGRIPAVPTGFVGSVTLRSAQPFSAAIVTPGAGS